MKKVHLLVLTILLGTFQQLEAKSAAPVIEWSKNIGGAGYDYGYGLDTVRGGGFVLAGQIAATSTNGDFTGRPTGRGTDGWVARMDDTGAILWAKYYGGSGADGISDIRTTSDGGFITAGSTNSSDGDITDKQPFASNYDFWVMKLDGDGEVVWSKTFGSSTRDEAYSVVQTFDGGYVVTGRTFGKADGHVSYIFNTTKSNYDFWVVKLSSSGILEWEKTYGGSENEEPSNIIQTADSGYVVVGSGKSSDGLLTGNKGELDYWIIKTDKTGNLQWQKNFGGSKFDVAGDVRQAPDGGYIVVGRSDSQDGDVSGLLHGSSEYWILRLSASGDMEWQQLYGGSSSDVANSVALTEDGGCVVLGSSQSDDGNRDGAYGGNDFWLIKLGSSGLLEWQKHFGGSKVDFGQRVLALGGGSYVLGGYSQSADFDLPANWGSGDGWIVKLMPTPADSLVVSVTGGAAPEITSAGSTLQLEAALYPLTLMQDVTWSIVPGTGQASVDVGGLVTAVRNGSVWAKAVSVYDPLFADSVELMLSGQVIPADSVVVTVKDQGVPQITMPDGVLELQARVYPLSAVQDVIWSIAPATGAAEISSSGVITAVRNGTVWARAFSVASPAAGDSLLVTISGQEGLSVNAITVSGNIRVYPNPVSEVLYMESDAGPVSAEIMDVTGRLLKSPAQVQCMTGAPCTLSLRGLGTGIYMLVVRDVHGLQETHKIYKH